jgi:two-component system, OmpR family, aerobic respiration control sensor histidine kinase ArcB
MFEVRFDVADVGCWPFCLHLTTGSISNTVGGSQDTQNGIAHLPPQPATAPPDSRTTGPLHRRGLLDEMAQAAFDRLTRLAARVLRTPIALVNLIEDDRQYFSGDAGMGDVRELPIHIGVCSNVHAAQRPLAIQDARTDPRFADNEIVTNYGLVAYLGVPVTLGDGRAVGTFCVVDGQPRRWQEDDVQIMLDLAESVVSELERGAKVRAMTQRVRMQADLLNAIGEAVVATCARGRITYWNRAAERLYGWKADDVIGRMIMDVTPTGMSRDQASDIMAQLAAGESWTGEFSVRKKDGTTFPALVTDSPAYDSDGNMIGIIGVSWDLTERKRTEQALRQAMRAAEQANLAKTEFLAAMSHELRTPLNAIAGYVELLALGVYGELQDGQREAVERVRVNQQHLLKLIDDVLHIARLESGRISVQNDVVAIADVLAGLGASIEPQARAQQIEFRCSSCDPLLRAHGDADRIRQILINLVGNAIKFTAAGGRVAVSCASDGGDVLIHVEDNGRGIAADRIDSVFEAFVQLGRDGNESSRQGVGLGLAISRGLARDMGGDLTAVSEPGRGSIFTLRLRGG